MNTFAPILNTGRRFDEKAFDGVLLVIIVSLVLFGAVMVFSAGIVGNSAEFSFHFQHLAKHVIHIMMGSGLMLVCSYIRLEHLQRSSRIGMFLGLLVLACLFIPGFGVEVNGSTRWFSIAGIRIQPAEVMKLITLVYVADYYARKQDHIHLFKIGIINIGVPIILLGFLLLMQPDFGTLVIIVAMTAGLMFIAGVPMGYFIGLLALTLLALGAIAILEPYRMDRLLSFQDPWADPFNKGFQLTQALMAVGRGGWLGVGLGNSLQKLNYLPHAQNDFLVAIIAEELGAIGVFVVMLLFILLLWRAFTIASRALQKGQRFSAYLAYGIGTLLVLNAGVHIGVNTGLLPTKGLNLPLMSAGGSSMITSLAAVGLLFAVDKQSRAQPRKRS